MWSKCSCSSLDRVGRRKNVFGDQALGAMGFQVLDRGGKMRLRESQSRDGLVASSDHLADRGVGRFGEARPTKIVRRS